MRLKWNCPACSAINTEQYNPAVINNGETDSVLSFCSNCNKQIELYITLSIETDWIQKVDGKIGTISDKSHRNNDFKPCNKVFDKTFNEDKLIAKIRSLVGNLKVGFSGTYEPFSLPEIKNIDQFETDVINAVLEEIIRS